MQNGFGVAWIEEDLEIGEKEFSFQKNSLALLNNVKKRRVNVVALNAKYGRRERSTKPLVNKKKAPKVTITEPNVGR